MYTIGPILWSPVIVWILQYSSCFCVYDGIVITMVTRDKNQFFGGF